MKKMLIQQLKELVDKSQSDKKKINKKQYDELLLKIKNIIDDYNNDCLSDCLNQLFFEKRNRLRNTHMLIAGAAGTGLNYVAKNFAIDTFRFTNDNIFIIDPFGDFIDFPQISDDIDCIKLNNNFLLDQFFNPLDLEEKTEDNIALKMYFLLTLFSVFLHRKLSKNEQELIESVCKTTYENYENPILKDFINELSLIENSESKCLQISLAPLVEFSCNTKTPKHNNLVYFNLQEISSDMKPVAILWFLEYIKTYLRKQSGNIKPLTSVFLPNIMEVEDSTNLFFDYIASFTKVSKMYGINIVFSEHNVYDIYTKSKYILKNIFSCILLKQSFDNYEVLQNIFNVADEHFEYLKNVHPGEGLFLLNGVFRPYRVMYKND